MPVEFDPAWEYWTPTDPEVADLLGDAAAVGVDGPLSLFDAPNAGDFGSRREWAAAVGLRFGRNPADVDRGRFTLGPERAPVRSDDNRRTVAVCQHCDAGFRGVRGSERYCSAWCRDRARERRIAERHQARLEAAERRAARWAGARATFARMYAAGDRYRQIAAAVGVKLGTLQAWRIRLGIPRRPYVGRQCEPRACERCGEVFTPRRGRYRFCGLACSLAATADKRRTRAASLVCECGVTFAPSRTDSRYCSVRCAARKGGPKPPAGLLARFAEMYQAGASWADMTAATGRRRDSLKAWRRRLGLPRRKRPAPKTAAEAADKADRAAARLRQAVDLQERFTSLWRAGVPVAGIMSELGVSERTVQNLRERTGVERRQGATRTPAERRAEAAGLRAQGLTLATIGDRMGVSKQAVMRMLAK